VGGGAFSPLSLSPHHWLEPSDLGTLFQERTGASATTPSEVDGVVGTMLDKSGNGHHFVAPSDDARPLLRNSGSLYWLEFDGVDDTLSVTFGHTHDQPFEAVSAFRRLDSEATAWIIGSGSASGQIIFVNDEIRLYSGENLISTDEPVQDEDFVLTDRSNGTSSRIAVDNRSYVTGNAGISSADDEILGGNPNNVSWCFCRFYGRVHLTGLLEDSQISQLRTYLAAKQGRVL
jgi:hypothetical protein